MPTDRFDHLFIVPRSFDAALAFYRDTLGWTVRHAWGSPDGEPRGAMLDGGGTALVIAEQHAADDRSWSDGVHGSRPTLHLAVDDLEARHAQLVAAGAGLRIVVPPEATHWGTRWFVVRDPDDNLIAFEQQL